MKLNRELQRSILELLATTYGMPNGRYTDESPIKKLVLLSDDSHELHANVLYLRELGLITCMIQETLDGSLIWPVESTNITARGLDFLQDDGGLSAILSTVTVKLHADTIRDLIETKVAESDLPKEQKSALIQQLKQLPAEALKQLTTRLISQGLDQLPNAIHWLQTAIHL